MTAVRALAPLEDAEGPIAPGTVFETTDEQAAAWKADGKVSLLTDEASNAKVAEAGHYGERTGREDVESTGEYGDRTGRSDTKPLEPEDTKKGKK
jgi:hypothetical protein